MDRYAQKKKAAQRAVVIASKKKDNRRSKGISKKVRGSKKGAVFSNHDVVDDATNEELSILLDFQAQWAREEEAFCANWVLVEFDIIQ